MSPTPHTRVPLPLLPSLPLSPVQLTQQFFQLVCNYVSVLELLSRYNDRKTVVGCFQCSYEMLQGVGEPAYASVAQFLVDFDSPFRQLPNVFAPHKKIVTEAVMSLKKIFDIRYLTPAMLRKDSPYNIYQKPHTMGVPTPIADLSNEMIPIDSMVQWICIAFCVVPEVRVTCLACVCAW
jgi:hypothetical protein